MPFDEEALSKAIAAKCAGKLIDCQYLPVCSSTNEHCLAQQQMPCLIVADQQTQGRGRRGKKWFSETAENLLFSIGLNLQIPADVVGLLSLLTGVSLATCLHDQGLSSVGLKWPNDILVNQRKLAGILIETRYLNDNTYQVCIGVGLNVNMAAVTDSRIENPATSLLMETGNSWDRQKLLVELAGSLINEIDRFSSSKREQLLERYQKMDVFVAQQVCVQSNGLTHKGEYKGITAKGELVVRVDSEERIFNSAEVSLRAS